MNKTIVFFVVILLAVGFSFLIPGVRRAVIKPLTVTGILRVAGVAPQVIDVYLFNPDTGAEELCGLPGSAYKPTRTPPADSYVTLYFNATAYDANGDLGNAYFYVCDNETGSVCNSGNAFWSSAAVSPKVCYTCNVEGFDCTNCCCNYTVVWPGSPTDGLAYYKKCGSWYVNFTVQDSTPYYDDTVRWWKDGMVYHLYFPYTGSGSEGSVIYLGSVNAGQWNNDTAQNTTKNGGNVHLSMKWNATDFTGYDEAAGDSIPIELCNGVAIPDCNTPDADTTFGIDDATGWPPSGWINETSTVQTPYPSYGADRCTVFACDAAADSDAMYDLWWHIYVAGGKLAGPYNNGIQVEWTYTETCD